MKKIWICFCILVCTIPIWSVVSASAAPEKKQTVRVGYFLYPGYHEIDEKGNYTGYGFEYLQEIAQYTNWNYEYVNASWHECLQMLENGEIDLLSFAQKDPARQQPFLYPEYSSGNSIMAVYIKADNADILYNDYESFEGKTVGIIEGSSHTYLISDFEKKHGFEVEIKEFSTEQELNESLETGAIDMVVTSDMRKESDQKLVSVIGQFPFYFITSKQNSELFFELEDAIRNIQLLTPSFQVQLEKKYNSNELGRIPVFTREESEFIKNNPVITAVYQNSWNPLEYTNEEGKYQGITKDFLMKISQLSGLEFHFIPVSTIKQSLEAISSGQAQIITSFANQYAWSSLNNLKTSTTYLDIPMVIVSKRHHDYNADSTLAMTVNNYASYRTSNQSNHEKVRFYATEMDCLEAVKNNEIDATHINMYTAQRLMAQAGYNDFQIITLNNYNFRLCMAISANSDVELLTILNKSILHISEEEENAIIISNTLDDATLNLWEIICSNPAESILILSSLFIILLLFLVLLLRFKSDANRAVQRKLDIDELTGKSSYINFHADIGSRLPLKESYALLYLDIGNFEVLNQTSGYKTGIQSIRCLSDGIRDSLKPGEQFARAFTDAFVLLLHYQGQEELTERIGSIRTAVQNAAQNKDISTPLLLPCGIRVIHAEDQALDNLVNKARFAKERAVTEKADGLIYFSDGEE